MQVGAAVRAGHISPEAGVVLHGAVGAGAAAARGGDPLAGFAAAVLTKSFTLGAEGFLDQINNDAIESLIAGAVGGTISEVTGGKFANGAVTAAIAYAYNQNGGATEQQSVEEPRDRAFKLKAEVQVTKWIQFAIDADRNVALNILEAKSGVSLSVDSNGTATLSSGKGSMSFDVDSDGFVQFEAFRKGIDLRAIEVGFGLNRSGDLMFDFTLRGPGVGAFRPTASVNVSVNPENAVLYNTGMLGTVARGLKNRNERIDNASGF